VAHRDGHGDVAIRRRHRCGLLGRADLLGDLGVYRDILKRGPDAAGLASWVGAAQNGAPMARIAAASYASSEFSGAAGSGDDTTWVSEVDCGVTIGTR